MPPAGAQSARHQGPIGVLDIGTSKIVCLIASVSASHGPDTGGAPALRIVGVGHQRSRGVKAGVITDMDQAEYAVRTTISQAERMAGVTLDEVYVSISCGRLRSQTFAANADIEDRVVADTDIARVMSGGRSYAEREGRVLVHMNRIGFRLDGAPGSSDPRGMAARRLTADLHAVTADEAPLRNLQLVVERCYLNTAGLIAAPYASALAATSEEERRLGVTCLDIGGGTTTIAAFAEGQLFHIDALPIGGHHITFDIARTLQTPLAEAVRIKALYGTLVNAQSNTHESFSYPLAGEADGAMYQTTKARLADVIRPRVAGVLAQVRDRLDAAGVAALAGERVVLTGGTAELVGIGEFAAASLGRSVRIAPPARISGLPPGLASPAFSTAAGLLFAAAGAGRDPLAVRVRDHMAPGYFGRVGQWLASGF